MFIKSFKTICTWFAEARHAWLAATVVMVAMEISYLLITRHLCPPEPTVRLTGLILQLSGIATVIWGISETRAFFGHPSLVSKITDWISRFPLFRGKKQVIEISPIIMSTKVSGRASQRYGAGDNPTIETRLVALEKNVASIYGRIDETLTEIDKVQLNAESALKREESLRQKEDSDIRKMLEATGTGGIRISAIGAVWLFVGSILSTASVEIAHLFN